jgi:YD repeat-containing protein
LKEAFPYNNQNRLTGVTLKRPSGQDLYCSVTYDAFGRMTSKQAVVSVNNVPQVTTLFSLPSFDITKVHALSQAQTSDGIFPSMAQTVTYTGFDKVSKVKQGTDSLCYSYGYDRQRILMEERVGSLTRTKQYWGNCEYITETTGNITDTYWLTYLTSVFGVKVIAVTLEGQCGSKEIDLGRLPPGVYNYTAYCGNKVLSGKLVVAH